MPRRILHTFFDYARNPLWLALVFPFYAAYVSHLRPLLQTTWANDTLIILDSGARLLEGKIPHVDYFAPIGVLTSAIVALGLYFGEMNVSGAYTAIEVASAVGAILIFALGLRSRLPWYLAFFVGFLVLEFGVSLRPLGYSPELVTLSGVYNRVGWILLALLFVNVLGDKTRATRRPPDFLNGLLLSALLATKLNLFIAGLALLAPLVWHSKDLVARTLRILISFFITTTVWMLVFRITPASFVADNLVVASAMPTDEKFRRLYAIFARNVPEFLISFTFVFVFALGAMFKKSFRDVSWALTLWAGAVAASLLAGIGSIAENEYLLSFISPLCVFALAPKRRFRDLGVLALVVYFSQLTLRANFASYAFRKSLMAQAENRELFQQIESPRMRGLYFATRADQIGEELIRRIARERKMEYSPANYAVWMSKAVELTDTIALKSQALLTLADDQSLSFVGGLNHTYHDFLFYHVGRVNKLPFPNDVAQAVANADLILKVNALGPGVINESIYRILKYYDPYVQGQFHLIRENEFWSLWAKN